MSLEVWVAFLSWGHSLETDSMEHLKSGLWNALLIVLEICFLSPKESHNIAKKFPAKL